MCVAVQAKDAPEELVKRLKAAGILLGLFPLIWKGRMAKSIIENDNLLSRIISKL